MGAVCCHNCLELCSHWVLEEGVHCALHPLAQDPLRVKEVHAPTLGPWGVPSSRWHILQMPWCTITTSLLAARTYTWYNQTLHTALDETVGRCSCNVSLEEFSPEKSSQQYNAIGEVILGVQKRKCLVFDGNGIARTLVRFLTVGGVCGFGFGLLVPTPQLRQSSDTSPLWNSWEYRTMKGNWSPSYGQLLLVNLFGRENSAPPP